MSNDFNSLNAITENSSWAPAERMPLNNVAADIYSLGTDNQSWQRTLSSFGDKNMKNLGFPDGFEFTEQQQQKPRDLYAPHNGMYTPVQPFGFEGHKGETWKAPRQGNEDVPWRSYLERPVVNEDGSSFYTYLGGINDQHGNNSFIASEKHDPDGRLLTRKAAYRHGVPMKFEMEGGRSIDVNVKLIESCLDPATGNYRTLVYPADASQPNGRSATPLRMITTPNGKSHMYQPNS